MRVNLPLKIPDAVEELVGTVKLRLPSVISLAGPILTPSDRAKEHGACGEVNFRNRVKREKYESCRKERRQTAVHLWRRRKLVGTCPSIFWTRTEAPRN